MSVENSETKLARMARHLRNSPILASLRVRLMLLVLLAVLPALGVVIYTAVEQRREGLEHARMEALRLVRTAATTHDQTIESTHQLLATVAQMEMVRARDVAACRNLFTDLLGRHEMYANFGALNPDGTLLAAGASFEIGGSEPEFFRKALATRDFVTGEYRLNRTTRKATLNVGFPVSDARGELRLVLFAELDLGWLYKMHAQALLPPGSSFTVTDRNRMRIMRFPDPEGRFIGETLPPTSRRTGPPALERTSIFRGGDGVLRLYASTRLGRIEPDPASISVGIPVDQAHATANAILRRNLIALSIAALLAFAAAWVGGDLFIVRRIHRLLSMTERIGEGDLSARTGAGQGDGELHQLARAFDEMAQNLQQRVAERERAEANLRALNEDLEQRVTARTLELKRSNEDLEQFAYVASHDLQEPLRMVTNYLQLLQNRYKSQLDNKAQDFIQIAVDGALRMHQLIGDLLTYSRVGTAGKPLGPVNANEALKNTLLNLKIAIEESGAKVMSDLLPTVKADMLQLTQLFQNLIGNAIKFRSDKPPEIHVSAQRGPRENEWQFSVRDNGIGIAPKDFDRIFLIFQRLHTREKYPGTGIGLALCKKIVERHGGRIWVESEPGEGTTFHFTIPAA